MGRVKVSFASAADWSTAAKAREFLGLLVSAGGVYVPRRYDTAQPLRHAFDPGDLDACAAFWSQNQFMILHGSRGLHAHWLAWWCYAEQGRLNSLSFSADESHYCRTRSVEALLELLRGIYLWGPMAYGYVCHSSDYDAKNVFGEPTRVWDGGVAYSSVDDPASYLPGIYWANYFGAPYVEFFGRERLRSVPAYRKEELPDGGFLLLTSPSPLDYGRPEVRALEESIIDGLGRDAFFEKSRPEKRCRALRFSFEQAASGRPLAVATQDPVVEVIPDPARFIAEAAGLAEALGRRLRGRLDYAPESLAKVDAFILRRSRTRPLAWASPQDQQVLRELTAYYGEVLRRHLGGQWRVGEGTGGIPHPAVVWLQDGRWDVEYPFARVEKLWEERVKADGLAVRLMLFRSGEYGRVEQHLAGLEGSSAPHGETAGGMSAS